MAHPMSSAHFQGSLSLPQHDATWRVLLAQLDKCGAALDRGCYDLCIAALASLILARIGDCIQPQIHVCSC